jgi:hemerythrin superfamily protein
VDALKLLTEQHKEVDTLIAKLEKDPADKDELFEELADKIAAHASMEEKLFYPAVRARQTEDLLRESVEEHLAVKRIIADMLELDSENEQWEAKLSVVKEQLEHHAHEEEEGELFPKVRKLFGKDELEALGGEMAALFEELLATHPSRNVPAETGEAAPI